MKWTRAASWVVASSAVAGFLLGGAVAKDSSLFGPTVASWVQAVGSVAAIVGAIFIERSSARRELSAREQIAKGKLGVCSRLVSLFQIKMQATLDGLREPHADPRFGKPIVQGYRGLASAMRAFPIAELNDPRAVVAFLAALDVADSAVLFVESMDQLGNREFPEDRAAVVRFQIEQFEGFLEFIGSENETLRQLAGV